MSSRQGANKVAALAAAIGLATTSGLSAQDPLSAIDWLSDSVADAEASDDNRPVAGQPIEDVEVRTLDRQSVTGIGLISPEAADLPADLWGNSKSEALARSLRSLPADLSPSLRKLVHDVTIARLIPPRDSAALPGQDAFFLARIDYLLDHGLLDEARTLLLAADTDQREVFRRWFDVSLLLGEENTTCRFMRTNPTILPTYKARIFCLARNGNWDIAALTLGTADALGILSPDDEALLIAFLDPEMISSDDLPPPPLRLTPLDFRLYEAVGERLSTATLPLAFARADLARENGWKTRLTAAERLAAAGAISSQELFALYREREPSASGGIWTRVGAVQDFDAALARGTLSENQISKTWTGFAARGLETALSEAYGSALALAAIQDPAAMLVHLSGQTTTQALGSTEMKFRDAILKQAPLSPFDQLSAAIAEGFQTDEVPVRHRGLIDEGRTGEALFRAIGLISEGAAGDTDAVADGIATLRILGFEQGARQAAIELLVLDRRG